MKLLHCLLIREHIQSSEVYLKDMSLHVRRLFIELTYLLNKSREAIILLYDVNEQIFVNKQSCAST